MGFISRTITLHLLLLFSPLVFSKTLLVLGDSISAGYGIEVQQGWVHLLQQSLGSQHTVINGSISGNTSGDGLARLPLLLNTHKPDIVIVELGGNDGLRGYPLTVLQKNLRSIIEQCQRVGANILLVGMQIPPNYGKRYSQQFQDVYPALAKQFQISLLPIFLESVVLKPGYIQNDGIHPTAIAQPELKDKVLSALQHLLR
jgi:acyl-CoA thioesterase I